MTRMVASLSALIFSIVLLVSGNAFLMTLLGIRLSIEQISPDVIGWVLVCYSIGFVLGTLYVQKIIGRVGHIRAFAVFAAMAAVVALMYPMAVSPLFWGVLRVLSGFSIAGVLVVIESWFSSRATSANRGALFAVYQIVFYLSAAGGQLFVNVGDPANFLPFSLAAILLTLALVPLALTRMEAPVIEQAHRMSVFKLARQSFSGMAGALISGVMIGGFYALGPVYATLVGLDVTRTSTFMASAIVAAMLLAWPLGRVCDRFDRRRVMFWVSLLAASSAIGVAVFGATQLALLTVLVGLFTGLSATLYPIAVAITNDRMDSSGIVAASATLLLSYGIGSVIGPITMAELINLLGPSGLFYGNAGFLLLLAVITSYRISHTVDVPVAEQEHFVPTMPEASPVLTEIDPRNEEFHQIHEVERPEEDIRQAG
ncbi:MFS transporter [Marinobacter persicus]|uniref:MFS family arabinose efflux permease n=1 Tax=Marinobacter persicus TaxID=930118 RepID=A0A2S6GA80_9GAMM|nr:MFS transporter [Marinobacter persicus]PPK53387.1 putative MFS family arabinose efflux permease [Marinobacter persicus]PPK56224.1 putative MFS family arabinose efflux permease [Marinobacter persicus]PPK59819.1 putative MFS family arabinose efflux permease [Marinobacter persicus]